MKNEDRQKEKGTFTLTGFLQLLETLQKVWLTDAIVRTRVSYSLSLLRPFFASLIKSENRIKTHNQVS